MATSNGKGHYKNHANTHGLLESAKPSMQSVGAQIKRVIELLKETRESLTQKEITQACGVEKSVFGNLKNNPRINYQGDYYSYKAKHELYDADDLINFLQKFPEGISVAELDDSYPNIAQDLKELQKNNKTLLLTNESREKIAYPNDMRYHDFNVDDALKELYRDIKIPMDFVEVEEDLKKKGMKPATDTKRRMAVAKLYKTSAPKEKKKKKGEITSRTKLTNAHLPELFSRI